MKKNKGITLIALVITIIVLLILAGISINMLSGDNSILVRATKASKETEFEKAKEELKIAYNSAYTNNMAKINTQGQPSALQDEIKTEIDKVFEKYKKANDRKASNIKINNNSEELEWEQDENAYTADIALVNLSDGSSEIATITVEKAISNENNTSSYQKASFKWGGQLSIEDIQNNASKYYGRDVLNYTTKSGINLGTIDWQLFYAGKIDDEDENEEEHIYLISKEYVENKYLPTVVKNGIKQTYTKTVDGETITIEAKPIAADNSSYMAYFALGIQNINSMTDGVIKQYSGANAISNTMRKLNSAFYKYLATQNSTNSTYHNIRSVAYMLDTTTWGDFKGEFADYAIGGPSLELFCKAYNQYKGTAYETNVSSKYGYKIRKTSNDNYDESVGGAVEIDTETINNPYSVSNLTTQAYGYWLASPMNGDETAICCIQRSNYLGWCRFCI